MTHQQAFLVRIKALADMVPNFTLSPELLKIYDMQLAPLGYDKVCGALDQIIGDRNSRDPFPSVKEIKAILTPTINPEHDALEAVSRIIASVSNIGPYQVQKARETIGELGWEVVKAEGGWENVCQNLSEDNIGMLRAQWKNIALAKMARAKAGLVDGPSLPEPAMQAKQIEIKNMVSRFALPMPKGDV